MTEVAPFPIGLCVTVVIGFEMELFSIGALVVWTLFLTSFFLLPVCDLLRAFVAFVLLLVAYKGDFDAWQLAVGSLFFSFQCWQLGIELNETS